MVNNIIKFSRKIKNEHSGDVLGVRRGVLICTCHVPLPTSGRTSEKGWGWGGGLGCNQCFKSAIINRHFLIFVIIREVFPLASRDANMPNSSSPKNPSNLRQCFFFYH